MKFTKGYWMNLPGVTNTDAVQVREVKVENDRVYLYTVPYHADMRAMGGPLLEMYISSPQPDIIRTEVLCSSYHNGPYTKKVCSSGCIGCHKCEKTCPQGAITVDNFLARIDWDKCTACGACASVCPTGAMVCGDFSGASRVQPLKKNCGAS